MPSKARSIFRYIISFLIAFVFLYFAFRGVKLSELWDAIKGVNYWWVALLVPINVLSHWVRAVRWAYILSPIKTSISKRNLFSAVMIGYAVNNVVPRFGELIRPYVLGKLEGVSKTSAFGTVVVERIIDMISFYFMVCAVLFIFPRSLDPFVSNIEMVRPFFLLGSIVALLIFVFLFFKIEAFFRFLAKILYFAPSSFVERVEKLLEKFYSGFAAAKLKNKLAVILIYSFTILGLYALSMYVPFFAFPNLVKPELDFSASIILLVVSSISWILPAPGALGIYHSFLSVAMVKLYNVDLPTALSYAILTHGITYILTTVLGVYYYFIDHLKLNELTSESANIE